MKMKIQIAVISMIVVVVASIRPAAAQQRAVITYAPSGNSGQNSGVFENSNWSLQDDQDSPSDIVIDNTDADNELKKKLAKYEAQLAEQDKLLEKQSKTIGDIKSKFKDYVKLGHGDETMKLFGRLHLDYWSFPQAQPGIQALEGGDPQDRFVFRRMRIGVKGDIDDNVFYKIEMEFAGGRNPSYRDAYFGIRDLPRLNTVLIGNHKRPYGLDHLNSSRFNTFIERPAIIESLNQDSRRLGISSNGYTDDLKYNWRYGVWNHRLTQSGEGYIGDHYQLELAGRLAGMLWYDDSSGGRGYTHLAVSGSVGFPDGRGGAANTARYRSRPEARSTARWYDTGLIAGANNFQLLGLESVTNIGPLQIISELQTMNIQRSAGFGSSVNLNGGYSQVSYFLTGEHVPWNRQTGCLGRVSPFENFFKVRDCDGCVKRGIGAWQVAFRYSYTDLTDDDIIGGDGDAFTLGLNWWWNKYTRWQFNYINGNVDRGVAGSGDYQIFGTRFMVDF